MSEAVVPSISPELRKRIMTGAAGAAALVLLIIFGGPVGMFVLATGLSLLMIDEFSRMVFSMSDGVEKRYVLLFATWFIALGSLIFETEYQLLVVAFLTLFAYFLGTANRHPENLNQHFKELMFSNFGLIYLALLPTYFPKIHALPNGVNWTLLFLLINWSMDTGAYFAGKRFGKTPLYPLISPKKTREGGIGGLLTAWIVTLAYKVIAFHAMSWPAVVIIPPLVASVAQVGDFCESLLKRAFDRKDSGSILPGHGGLLDRFDGVVFSLPIMYACIHIFA